MVSPSPAQHGTIDGLTTVCGIDLSTVTLHPGVDCAECLAILRARPEPGDELQACPLAWLGSEHEHYSITQGWMPCPRTTSTTEQNGAHTA